jgi:tetraacyldisaccharide 4'-kinase
MSLVDFWYRSPCLIAYLLLPFSLIFRGIVSIRRFFYRVGIKKTTTFSVPIIVVGNIVVGGAGKTPLVIWLVKLLQQHGYKPGVISHGYGVKNIIKPQVVTANSLVSDVGDEAVLVARHVACPVVIASTRSNAINELLKYGCDVIVGDDGLQHYAMGRDIEIAVVDAQRLFGNGYFLPAGPLRESVSRLKTVDFVVYNGACEEAENIMKLLPDKLTAVADFKQHVELTELIGKSIHAIAGIGNPERFFQTLQQLGFTVIKHSFPDHYNFKSSDINFGKDEIVIMTEKDAVKCQKFADNRHWFLPISAVLNEGFEKNLLLKLKACAKRG